ncbi:PspC domain-containing protein [Lactobacillus sp. LC28-10]|uniref:PspC domain-containing protein n=1 Tax=Secundilactobacillus angelensis TaxID=2722706 RepID=A0ABX1KYY3_9LACO|nr:PspC domain-containing protein [Secundilactobacillus angelensis]MCH5462194.1 PspC domain-containing protein [Secundilactobacillus angelensis]NLR18485.1 PspC domain-containing protein [Secundilactobacillus angelensis]
MNSKRRLTRSSKRILTGVLGGIAAYFGISAALVRIIFVILTIYPGHILFGLLVYLLLTVLIPEDSGTMHHSGFWGMGQQSRSRKELHDVTEEDTDKK